MKPTTSLITALAACSTLVAGSASAATILTSDDFESSLGDWTTDGSASLYSYGGLPDENFAPTGNGAVELPKGETITLTNPLPLDSQGYTSVTLTLNHQWVGGSNTRRARIYYAADGVNFTELARYRATDTSVRSLTLTLIEGSDHTLSGDLTEISNTSFIPVFTDTAKFRIAGFVGSGASGTTAYVDDIVISAVPEPGSLALMGLGVGGLLIARRRRG